MKLTTKNVDPVARRLSGVPARYRGLYQRTLAGNVPPRTAIRLYCCECLDYNPADIRACASRACPLYAFRPFTGAPVRGRGKHFASPGATEAPQPDPGVAQQGRTRENCGERL